MSDPQVQHPKHKKSPASERGYYSDWLKVIEAKMPNENPEPSQQYVGLCPECQTGVMRLQYLTYFTWLNEELVTVPNFPAWVCDICGRREYDSRAITWLNTLLSPDTGRRRITPRRKPSQKRTDQPHAHD